MGSGRARLLWLCAGAVLALSACQPTQTSQLTITNDGDAAVSLFEQREGTAQRTHVADVPANESTRFAIPDNGCVNAVLIAVQKDGTSSTFGPPLCAGQTWHVH